MRARVLQEMRQRLGNRLPRVFPREAEAYHRAALPDWARRDAISIVHRDRRFLFEHGHLVWGAFIQANSLLFEPGHEDCPAMMLYGIDEAMDDDVWTLREVASGLFGLKETRPSDPEVRRFAEVVTDELQRAMRLPVPKALSRGYTMYSTTAMIHRKFLPSGVLASQTLPLLVHRETEATIPLPSYYWSERLLFDWGEPVGAAAGR